TSPTWLFDIDSLTKTMNYQPVHAENQTNSGACFQDNFDAEKTGEEVDQSYMLFPMWSIGFTNPHNNAEDAAFDGKEHDFDVKKPESKVILSPSSILEDIIYSNDEDVVGAEADFNNLESSIPNRVLVTKPQNKTPYELLLGRAPNIGFMRPFSCLVTILNTLDPLVSGGNQPNPSAGIQEHSGEEIVQQYVLFSSWSSGSKDPQNTDDDTTFEVNTNEVNAASTPVTAIEPNSTNNTSTFSAAGPSNTAVSLDFEIGDDEEDVGAEANFSNLETNIIVSPIPTTRVQRY
nr:retrovirus-related Pol polyprotein from transposon TNT 1-94 [Tanacetum cinerariifolium]